MKNILLFSFIFISVVAFCQEKSHLLMRSTTSMAGVSNVISFDGNNFLMQQSVGQASPAGTVFDNEFVAQQGFLHPYVLARLADQPDQIGLDVYPNPFINEVNINFDEPFEGKMYLSMFDYRGRLVAKEIYEEQQYIVFDAKYFSKGTYFMRIVIGDAQKVVRLIKAN